MQSNFSDLRVHVIFHIRGEILRTLREDVAGDALSQVLGTWELECT
jgi:hypothetical protein